MLQNFLLRIEKTITQPEELSTAAKMAALLLAFLAPLQGVVGVMMFFLMADTLSAIYLRYRKVKNRKVRSPEDSNMQHKIKCASLFWKIVDPSKLEKTVEKIFAYPTIALVCFVFDVAVLKIDPSAGGFIGRLSFTNMAFAFICVTDFKSFLRNMGKATGNSLYETLENHFITKFKKK